MTPFLSFVVGARNDDYGGNFLGRMRNFLACLAELCDRYGLDAELVVTEWNPPPQKDRLVNAVDWPDSARLAIRVVHVPGEIHDALPNATTMPIFEYIAKNVGIRRATGTFILSMNPDLLLDRPLMRLFARRALDRGSFYRVDRYDVVPPLPEGSVGAQLDFCARNISKVNVLGDSISFATSPRGWRRTRFGIAHAVKQHFGDDPPERSPDPVRRLHTNASGDFLLIHRDEWHRLRGYPEFYTASHIDSYMCAVAASAGLKQEALSYRYRIYHQEHARAVDWSNIEATTRPITSYADYASHAREMLTAGEPVIFNDENWGLGDSDLAEQVVRP